LAKAGHCGSICANAAKSSSMGSGCSLAYPVA
jgi:hypothetical protein